MDRPTCYEQVGLAPNLQMALNSADGKPPASPNIYYTTIITRFLVYEVMQDFYHQQYFMAQADLIACDLMAETESDTLKRGCHFRQMSFTGGLRIFDAYLYVCVCIYTHIHLHKHIHVCIYICTHTYLRRYLHILHLDVCTVYVYMYVYMYTYMDSFVYAFNHVHTRIHADVFVCSQACRTPCIRWYVCIHACKNPI